MRIVYLTPQYAPSVGGVERHVAELAERAVAAGHEVEVLTQTADEGLPRHERIDGVSVRRFASVNGSTAYGLPPGLFAHLVRAREQYDIVHAHGYHALPALGALGAGELPVVFTPHYHGTGHTGFARLLHRPYRPLGRMLFRRADAVVCVSQAERELIRRDFPEAAGRARVIPNGVDVERIRAAEPVRTVGRVLLSVGRLAEYKQVDRLISALPHLPADVRAVVVGAGPAREGLEQLAASLGVADRAEFLGRVDDDVLASWLRSADVLVSLSLQEAYGLVLLEGLAGGAAIVASDIPAHREVLAGHPGARLVDPAATPETVAEAIDNALRTPSGDRGSVPSWHEVAVRTWELYDALTARRVVTPPRLPPVGKPEPSSNGSGPPPPARVRAPRRGLRQLMAGRGVRGPGLAIVVWLGFLAAVGLISWAYSLAATSQPGATRHFDVFWLGLAAFLVPAAVRLAGTNARRGERAAIVAGAGLLFYLPKFLRSPDGPIYADELAHWRQTEVLGRTGDLFEKNPFISVVDSFPGLHALSDVLRELAGLSTWQVGVGVIALCMALTLVGIFLLGEELLGSARLGSLAALIYAACPSFAFFDAQYGYESLGMPLLVWVLVAVSRLQRPGAPFGQRAAWFGVAAVLVGGLVITHHLTALVMAGVLGLLALLTVGYAAARHEPLRSALPVVALAALAIGAVGLWIGLVADDVGSYLGPHLTNGFGEFTKILEREQGGRQLFAQSTAPVYERRLAYAAPLIAGLLTVAGLWRLRTVARLRPMLVAVVLLGLAYFPSVPFVLTQAGAEGARRSWAFSYIGVALLAAVGAAALARVWQRRRRLPLGRVAVAAALLTLLLGNTASGLSVEYRFPGPYVFGSDTRSLTTELVAAQEWFTATQGRDRRLVADRASGLAFGQLGQNWTERAWSGFPLWNFFLRPERPAPAVFRSLRFLGTDYLVVDKRIPTSLPRTGVYMTKEEPGARAHETPPPASAIEKYRRVPWAVKVFESDNLELYRLDYEALNACADQAPEPGISAERCP